MSIMITSEKRIRTIIYTAILSIIALYAGQGLIIHLRLHTMKATLLDREMLSEVCEKDCVAEFRLKPRHKYMLLGHVMKTHVLIEEETNEEIIPSSNIRGVAAESWAGLRVYAVEANKNYKLIATKPKAVKMGYFVGIYPRSTDHEGVLSIPDISPTVSTITGMAGFGLLALLLFAAYLAPTDGADGRKRRQDLIAISSSSVAALVFSLLSFGVIDSLLPDGETRSKILRSCLLMSIIIPIATTTVMKRLNIRSAFFAVCIQMLCVAIIAEIAWPWLRAGMVWAAVIGLAMTTCSFALWSRNMKPPAILCFVSFIDVLRPIGIILVTDYPPIYLWPSLSVSIFCMLSFDAGSINTLSMASVAYSRFKRDIGLSRLSEILSHLNESGKFAKCLDDALPVINQIIGAERITILVNLPFGRPITKVFDSHIDAITTHDDGKIPGSVALRAMVYGDEAWFEPYDAFAQRLNVPVNPALKDASYICVAPIRVDQSIVAVLMMTRFDDKMLKKLEIDSNIEDQKTTAKMITERFGNSLTTSIVNRFSKNTEQSKALQSLLRNAIATAQNTPDFFLQYCKSIFTVTKVRVCIHVWHGDQGQALTQWGFYDAHWQPFVDNPFNLSSDAKTAYGSIVVAFRENKSSYIKNVHEIFDKLHPRTREMLSAMNAMSMISVPLHAGDQKFAVTLISEIDGESIDPRSVNLIEATEALFDAAVSVMSQRTSVLALGQLANRLIGDDEVRNQIISAAKQEEMPMTVGTPRTSFLLLFDLAASSHLPADAEQKAKAYGTFYDAVNQIVRQQLGGVVRKTIGDAVIATWDGTETSLKNYPDLLNRLDIAVQYADGVARSVGCKGVRAVLHHGDYFFGLVGTATFGQIDVIGRGIDEVCKLEGTMKSLSHNEDPATVAISVAACAHISRIDPQTFKDHGYYPASSSINTASNANFQWFKTQKSHVSTAPIYHSGKKAAS